MECGVGYCGPMAQIGPCQWKGTTENEHGPKKLLVIFTVVISEKSCSEQKNA